MKLIKFILIFVLITQIVSSYQQSYLEFELDDTWAVIDQRTAVQAFQKDDLYFEIRNLDEDNFDAEEFARLRDGEVAEENNYDGVNEKIIIDESNFFILSTFESKGETYAISLVGDKNSLESAKQEMKKIYESIEIKDTQNFIEAEWEEELLVPEPLPFSKKYPIRWGSVIFWVVVILIVLLIVRKIRKKRKKKKTPKRKRQT